MHERLSLSSPVSVMNEPECVGWRRMNGPVAQGGAGHDGPEALKTQDLLRPATLVKTSHGPGLFSIISEGGELRMFIFYYSLQDMKLTLMLIFNKRLVKSVLREKTLGHELFVQRGTQSLFYYY